LGVHKFIVSCPSIRFLPFFSLTKVALSKYNAIIPFAKRTF
jgi:hypothetical protein